MINIICLFTFCFTASTFRFSRTKSSCMVGDRTEDKTSAKRLNI